MAYRIGFCDWCGLRARFHSGAFYDIFECPLHQTAPTFTIKTFQRNNRIGRLVIDEITGSTGWFPRR